MHSRRWRCLVVVAIAGVGLTASSCGSIDSVPDEIVSRSAHGVLTVTSTYGYGSGVVWDAQERLVVTARHVVGDDQQVTVITPDGGPVTATVLADDGLEDIALLQIGAAILPKPPERAVGRPGDPVAVIGRPVDAGLRTDKGLLIGYDRTVPGRGMGSDDLIELEADVRPGDSGGGVYDRRGALLGILVAGVGLESESAFRTSYAVPIARVEKLIPALLTGRFREMGYLGIDAATVTTELAALHELPSSPGVAVLAVEPGTPADRAGLRYRDVLTAADGRPLARVTDLDFALDLRGPRGRLRLAVRRESIDFVIDVQLTTRPTPPS